MTAGAVYPTSCSGAVHCRAPLRNPVVRLVFGDPRNCISPVAWSNKASTEWESGQSHLWLECTSDIFSDAGDEYQQACVPLLSTRVIPDQWMDFSFQKLDQLKLTFCVYSTETRAKNGRRIRQGHACVVGIELASLKGLMVRPIVDNNQQVIGTLTFDYIVIKPFIMPKVPSSFESAARIKQEKNRSGLESQVKKNLDVPKFAGHRGMGKTSAKRMKENTVLSYLEAARDGHVSHIELDVQLTKDGYPVIYHDWFFRTHGRDKDKDASPMKVPLYHLTLDEFESLYNSGIRQEEHLSHPEDYLQKSLEFISNNAEVRRYLIQDRIRTLADVCRCLPEDIGILVEVKYPAPNVQESDSIPFPERNEIVDRVLHDLFSVEANTKRSIIFLSFEPDICAMLSLKQDIFPVFFSHCNGIDKPCDESDPRCISIDQGITFAQTQQMDGLLLFDHIVKHDPDVVPRIKGKGLGLLTYGGNNSIAEWAVQQIRSGVDGVIADDIRKVVREASPQLGLQNSKGNGFERGPLISADPSDLLSGPKRKPQKQFRDYIL